MQLSILTIAIAIVVLLLAGFVLGIWACKTWFAKLNAIVSILKDADLDSKTAEKIQEILKN